MKTLEGMVDAIESRMRERLAAGSSQMLSKRCLSIDYEITTRSERLAEARKLLRKNGSERRTSIVLRMKVFAVILWEYLAHSPVEVVEVWRLVPDRRTATQKTNCGEQEVGDDTSSAAIDERLFLYAVAVCDDGIVLTVYEDGKACTVELSDEMARELADLLTRRGQ